MLLSLLSSCVMGLDSKTASALDDLQNDIIYALVTMIRMLQQTSSTEQTVVRYAILISNANWLALKRVSQHDLESELVNRYISRFNKKIQLHYARSSASGETDNKYLTIALCVC